jgi:predicted O-linked N-acetylglucosamine transferase (SPINDLY family)
MNLTSKEIELYTEKDLDFLLIQLLKIKGNQSISEFIKEILIYKQKKEQELQYYMDYRNKNRNKINQYGRVFYSNHKEKIAEKIKSKNENKEKKPVGRPRKPEQ